MGKNSAGRQAIYRERHKDDLRKARQVASNLVRLRISDAWLLGHPFDLLRPLKSVAESLKDFLTEAELAELLKELMPSVKPEKASKKPRGVGKASSK